MKISMRLAVGSILSIVALTNAVPAQADPLIPLTPNEIQYLENVRKILTVSHDNAAFRSDGELLGSGKYTCIMAGKGLVGYESTLISPAITQLAFIYLCPS